MGKKGKARQDKFYHLAKETGYRSRASFKLLQLNRKFEFLEKSRVVIDLCAAPGSWMQIAKQHMPVSSLIIGIDLFPIKPIQGCICLQEDITTEKCHQSLKKELAGWKADVVLHDGAPNVGQNWIYDAFIQNQLVLSALKLATEFLTKGGWFVTKIFRSKDYQSLMWVLQQLFKRVHSTKPHASRMESAEIFVICQGFKAPDKLDPKFLDPKYVFQEVEDTGTTVKGLQATERSKPKAGGYEEGITSLHKTALVSEFVRNENFVDILNTSSVIKMDDDAILNHPLTTEEIKECCQDVKVLGRKDLKALLTWRKLVKKDLEKVEAEEVVLPAVDEAQEGMESEDDSDEDLVRIDQQVKELEAEKAKEAKRLKKKMLKDRRNLQEKMRLKMVIPGDSGPGLLETKTLFALTQIKSGTELDQVADQEADMLAEEPVEKAAPKPKKASYEKEKFELDSSGRFFRRDEDSEEELVFNSDDEYESDVAVDSLGITAVDSTDESDTGEASKKNKKSVRFSAKNLTKTMDGKEEEELAHPLLTDLEEGDADSKRKKKADKWFMKGALQNLDDEEDEDIELDFMARRIAPKQLRADLEDDLTDDDESEEEVEEKESEDEDDDDEDSDDSDSENSDFDVQEDFVNADKKKPKILDGLPEPAPAGKARGKKRSLTAEALALGSTIIRSSKARRDFSDDGWNRYAFNDDNLPDWFIEDERKHSHKDLPITKELVQEYRDRMKEINVRPIKKVVEAKARKKRRVVRRMEKVKKKADVISENMGMSDYDKAQQIRHLHKKATKAIQKKDKEVTYVVAKKHQAGKRAVRPSGVKGHFKVVDKRMKKDDKKRKAAERKQRGRKASKPKKK